MSLTMSIICFLIIFVTDRWTQVVSESSTSGQLIFKTFSTVQNVDVPPGFFYYTEMACPSHLKCALFCLLDDSCKGSVFTADTCHLVSEFVLPSQLQTHDSHVFLSKYKCSPRYTGNNYLQWTKCDVFIHTL